MTTVAADEYTLAELLQDPIYRRFFGRAPAEPVMRHSEPWFIYVLVQGRWRRVKRWTYKEAYDFVRINRGKYRDLVIVSRRRWYGKPRGFVVPAGLRWCGYCRRPTAFRYFLSHHAFALRNWPLDDQVRRCSICGISESGNTSC